MTKIQIAAAMLELRAEEIGWKEGVDICCIEGYLLGTKTVETASLNEIMLAINQWANDTKNNWM